MQFPKWKYHKTKTARVVESEAHEKALGEGWVDSPADHGIETAPGVMHDAEIAKKAEPVIEAESFKSKDKAKL